MMGLPNIYLAAAFAKDHPETQKDQETQQQETLAV